MERITKDHIGWQENHQENVFGYVKYKISGRYGYQGIDEHNKEGGIVGTYSTGHTKREAYTIVAAIIEGAEQMKRSQVNPLKDFLLSFNGICYGDIDFILSELTAFEVTAEEVTEYIEEIEYSKDDTTNLIIGTIYQIVCDRYRINEDRIEYSVNALASNLLIDGEYMYTVDDVRKASEK